MNMKVTRWSKGMGIAGFFAATMVVGAVAVYQGEIKVPVVFPLPDGSETQIGTGIVSGGADMFLQWDAEVTSKVYSNYPGNPWGGYTFTYTVANRSTVPGATAAQAFFNFDVLFAPQTTLDVGYLQPGGESPLVMALGSDGTALGWLWAFGGLSAGDSSATLVVHSPFKGYTEGMAVVIGAGTGQDYRAWVPLSVPEPSTYAGLFALGLAGFAAYRRTRI